MTYLGYDSLGRVISREHPSNGSGFHRIDRFFYHGPGTGGAQGLLSYKVVDSTGTPQTTAYSYDIYGQLSRRTTPNGDEYRYHRNALGEIVLAESRPFPRQAGALTGLAPPRGGTPMAISCVRRSITTITTGRFS